MAIDSKASVGEDRCMNVRRFSISLPTPIAENLAAIAVRSGLRPGEVLEQALLAYPPLRCYARPATERSNHPAGSYLPSGGGGVEKATTRPPVVGRAATFLRDTFKIVGVADAR